MCSRPRLISIFLLAVIASICCTSGASAEPGAYDRTFGGGGRVVTDFRGLRDSARAVDQIGGGGFLAVGRTDSGRTGFNFGLAKYRRDGSLDRRFGSRGLAQIGFRSAKPVYEGATDFVALGNGKIVVVGESNATGGRAADLGIAKFTPRGQLARGFARSGKRRLDLGSSDYMPYIARAPGGGLIVASTSRVPGGGLDFAALKLKPNGGIDRSFGDRGATTLDFGGAREWVAGLQIASDGTIFLGGQTCGEPPGCDYAVAALRPDGEPVESFGDQGVARIVFENSARERTVDHIVLDGDRIVLGGYNLLRGTDPFELVGLRLDGSLDPDFGEDGQVSLAVRGKRARLGGLAVQPNGKLVLAGSANRPGWGNCTVLLRVGRDGGLDGNFGRAGEADHPLRVTRYFDAAITKTGRLIVAGQFGNGRPREDFALARFRLG